MFNILDFVKLCLNSAQEFCKGSTHFVEINGDQFWWKSSSANFTGSEDNIPSGDGWLLWYGPCSRFFPYTV